MIANTKPLVIEWSDDQLRNIEDQIKRYGYKPSGSIEASPNALKELKDFFIETKSSSYEDRAWRFYQMAALDENNTATTVTSKRFKVSVEPTTPEEIATLRLIQFVRTFERNYSYFVESIEKRLQNARVDNKLTIQQELDCIRRLYNNEPTPLHCVGNQFENSGYRLGIAQESYEDIIWSMSFKVEDGLTLFNYDYMLEWIGRGYANALFESYLMDRLNRFQSTGNKASVKLASSRSANDVPNFDSFDDLYFDKTTVKPSLDILVDIKMINGRNEYIGNKKQKSIVAVWVSSLYQGVNPLTARVSDSLLTALLNQKIANLDMTKDGSLIRNPSASAIRDYRTNIMAAISAISQKGRNGK